MPEVPAGQTTSPDAWIEFARTRDPALRDRLISDNIGLARRLAHRFAHRGQPYDDLAQVASIALIKAVDRFDPGGTWPSAPSPPAPSSAS